MNASKIYPFPSNSPEFLNAEAGNGSVKATAYVMVIDFAGNIRRRSVSIGREYSVSREAAKNMANNIREGNPDLQMRVQYTKEM